MTDTILLESSHPDLKQGSEKNQMDNALKQRLVGASVLIVLAVIVLPMLLGGRSDTLKQESRQIELPAKPDEVSIETRRFPIGVPSTPDAANQPAGRETAALTEKSVPNADSVSGDGIDIKPLESPEAATQEVDANLTPPADSTPRVEAKPPAITTITLSSGKQKDVNVTPSATDQSQDSRRYLVQVASFSSEKNANALADSLRAKDLNVLMDVVDRTAGLLHRVRVGPFAERSEADSVVTRLRAELQDLSPRVLDLRPDDSAPVSMPSDPLVRWVVQVGSFDSAEKADALVAKLRLADLPAFSEKVTSTGGEVYKVRVGPEINRDKAAALAQKIKADHQLDTYVTTQE